MKKFFKLSAFLIPLLFLAACDTNTGSSNQSAEDSSVVASSAAQSSSAVSSSKASVASSSAAQSSSTVSSAEASVASSSQISSSKMNLVHYDASDADFFNTGNIEYYYDEETNTYYDKDMNVITSITTPVVSHQLSVLINDTEYKLNIETESDGYYKLSKSGINVKEGDSVTICLSDDKTKEFNFFKANSDSNLTSDNKIHNDAENVEFVLEITPNGITLDISGYESLGVVININGTEYGMDYVSYYDNITMTYIYGWFDFEVNDSFYVLDKDNDIVYDYDDISTSQWNKYDFHQGRNNEFIIDTAGRYGIEYLPNDSNEIYIYKVFDPVNSNSFELQDNSANTIAELTEKNAENGDLGYEEISWYITHDSIQNNTVYQEYYRSNSLKMYSATCNLEANALIRISDLTNNNYIGGNHLTSVYPTDSGVSVDGDYIKIGESSTYLIAYFPIYDIIYISEVTMPTLEGDVIMYLGGNQYPLYKDSNNCVTYEFDANEYDHIMFMNPNMVFISYTMETDLDATVVQKVESSGSSSLMFYTAGHFKLTLNLDTLVLKVEGEVAQPSGISYDSVKIQYILLDGSSKDPVTMTKDSDGNFTATVEFTTGELFCVMVSDYTTYESYRYKDLDTSVSSDIAEVFSGVAIMITSAGTYVVTFNVEAETINLTAQA